MDIKRIINSIFGYAPNKTQEPFSEKRKEPKPRQQEAFDEVPRYPPFSRGLPVVSGKRLIHDQMELVMRIKQAAGVGDDLFESHYLSVIHRYVEYVHLLPASERHHHRGAGGLLRHGLEVAHYALQLSDTVLWSQNEPPSIRSKLKPRWRLACFCAALAHDLGKPISDVEVINRDGSQTWNPFGETLVEWANRNGIDRVFLRWRESRHRRHETLTPLICERIIGKDTFFYLSEGQPDILKDLMESVVGAGNHKINHIARIVSESDSESVAKDLREMRLSGDADYGVPVERHLIDAMRSQIKGGHWEINKPGSIVWHLKEGLFLLWPKAAHSCRTILSKQGVPGIPSDPDTIAEILLERGLAEYFTPDATTKHSLWQIKPEVGSFSASITVLKLASIEMLIDPPPPVANGYVVNAAEPEPKTASPQENATSKSGGSQNTKDTTPKDAPQTKHQDSTKPTSLAVTQSTDTTPPSQPFDGLSPGAWLEKQGRFARVLNAIASDIATGKSKLGDRAEILSADAIAIKWPEGVIGYGWEPGELIQRGIEEGLLIGDTMKRMKEQMLTLKSMNDARALRISGTHAQAFIAHVKSSPPAKAPAQTTSGKSPPNTPAPEPAPAPVTKKTDPAKSMPSVTKSDQAIAPPQEQANGNELAKTIREHIESALKQPSPPFRVYQDSDTRKADHDDLYAWISEKTGETSKRKINIAILELGMTMTQRVDDGGRKKTVINLTN